MRRRMKRGLIGLAALVVTGVMTGCGETDVPVPEVKNGPAEEAEKSSEERENPSSDDAENALQTEGREEAGSEDGQDELTEDVAVLGADKICSSYYGWNDEYGRITVKQRTAQILLREDSAKAFPDLAKSLKDLTALQQRMATEEIGEMEGFAKESLEQGEETFRISESQTGMWVRRSDERAFSILEQGDLDYGMLEDYRGAVGHNFDTATGKRLKLSDVVTDSEQLPGMVRDAMLSRENPPRLTEEDAVEKLFRETKEDDLSWTLEYDGITFWFNRGSITRPQDGLVSVKIPFEGNESLFDEKYRTVPKAYTVGLPTGVPFEADSDADGKSEVLTVTPVFSEEAGQFTGVTVSDDEDMQTFEMMAYVFRPYYVKCEDGRQYLYLFRDEGMEGNRQMQLTVFEWNEGRIRRIGDKNVGMYYRQDSEANDIFEVPTDPDDFRMDEIADIDTKETPSVMEGTAWTVGEDGMPEKK